MSTRLGRRARGVSGKGRGKGRGEGADAAFAGVTVVRAKVIIMVERFEHFTGFLGTFFRMDTSREDSREMTRRATRLELQ